jgi:hypothetical protein
MIRQLPWVQLGAAENLVVALVGLRRFKFPKKRTLQPILVRTDKKIASSLPCVASFIERTLVSAQPTGVGARELSRLVHGRFAGTELSTSDINALCRCLRTVEKRGDRYHALGSRADFYELVLRREGKPLLNVHRGYSQPGSALCAGQPIWVLGFGRMGASGDSYD